MRMCCCTGSNAAPFVVILGGAMVAAMSAGLHAGASTSGNQPDAPRRAALPAPATDPAYVLDHEAALIDGTVQDLNAFEGRVVLIVNTASRCGLTPQYEALEKLYRAHKKDGLVILGFPANDFGNQEPGSNEQIREFCSSRFEVSFPMFEKISVVGDDAHPLYKQHSRPD